MNTETQLKYWSGENGGVGNLTLTIKNVTQTEVGRLFETLDKIIERDYSNSTTVHGKFVRKVTDIIETSEREYE